MKSKQCFSKKVINEWLSTNHSYSYPKSNSKSILLDVGRKNALELFKKAAKKVPAYGDFLKAAKINPTKIRCYNDLESVPATTKENYVEKYPVSLRCWEGKVSKMQMVSTSSGTTGSPIFWPRNIKHELDGAMLHEFIFNNIFNVEKNETLFVNGFAMGNWIAGTFTHACVSLVALKNYPLTITTPGYSPDDIINTLTGLGREFKQVIITGHTPFIKELLERAINKGVDIKGLNIKLMGAGQGVTENWREYVIKLLGAKDYFRTFINIYGSADASLMGFETPNSIRLRKKLYDNPSVAKEMFNDDRLPSIYSFDPRFTFFDAIDGELHITKDSGCPLIHYNIHDRGGLLSPCNQIGNTGLPLLYLFGREKFMVKIFGANIYTEHVQLALNNKSIQSFLTGRFKLELGETENKDPLLVCRVEASANTPKQAIDVPLIEKIFIEEVAKVNGEYKFVLNQMRSKVIPKIIVHDHGDVQYFPTDKVVKLS